MATVSWDGSIDLWNLQGNHPKHFQGPNGPFGSISFTPDGQKLAIVSRDDDKVYLCNLKSQEKKCKASSSSNIASVSFSHNSSANLQKLAIAFTDGKVCLGNIQSLDNIGSLKNNKKNCFDVDGPGGWGELKFSPDDQILGFASMDGRVHLWNVQGKPQKLLEHKDGQDGIKASAGPLVNFSFSPNSQMLTTVSLDGAVSLWDLQGQQLATFRDNNQETMILNASFIGGGQSLATVSASGTIQFRPVENLDQLLRRGCQWLKDYLATHPDEQKKLTVCSK